MVVHLATPIIAIATVIFAVWRLILWRSQQRDVVREVGIWALFAWALMVVTLTFFPMVIIFYDWTSGLNLIPFASIRQLLTETAPEVAFENIAGNIVLFVPFGLLLPLLFVKVDTRWAVAWRAAVVSTSIELVQWITGARATDVDDIILNTSGALVGYAVYRLLVVVIATSTSGTRTLERLATKTRREPLTLGLMPIGLTLLFAIPLMVTPLITGTLADGGAGILAHATAQHPGSSVLVRGDFEEHTFVVVGSRSGERGMTLVGFERVLPGRFTWASTSDLPVGDGSRFAWMVTAFNTKRDEVPFLVIWGRNEAGASRFEVAADAREHIISIDDGVFIAAIPIDPDRIETWEFVARAQDGTDLTDQFAGH